ncbi:MAG: hypothetical protein ACFFDM_09195 [Candidatus Thorarchaeota archaeon]
MVELEERPRILRAIKKCLVNGDEYFENAMTTLDEIGRGSVGVGMTPLVGGYAIKDPKENYRTALINIDSAEKALKPLIKRFKDGRVNQSHFTSDRAIVILGDIAGLEFDILIRKLTEGSGRESIWYRLKEIRAKMNELLELIAET